MKKVIDDLLARWRSLLGTSGPTQEQAEFQSYFKNSLDYVENNAKAIAYDFASVRYAHQVPNHRRHPFYSPEGANPGDFQRSYEHFLSHVQSNKRGLAADMAHDFEDGVRRSRQIAMTDKSDIATNPARLWGGPGRDPQPRVNKWLEYAKTCTPQPNLAVQKSGPALEP